jgi:serine/threonine-protein kinase mTOR
VESLISINRKLDLQEAALGVLKASSLGERLVSDIDVGEQLTTKFTRHHVNEMYYSVTAETIGINDGAQDLTAKQELWLAKLGSWIEALGVYQQKLQRDPNDFEAVLGCMRCFDARGEWRKVLDLADHNWHALFGSLSNNQEESAKVSFRSQRKAMRICAQAAWRLGQWDDLEKYSSQLVQGQSTTGATTASSPPAPVSSRDALRGWVDFDGAFYSAVLHIHRKEWNHAADAIDAARRAMDARLTALLAESYSRAYPSMVTCQTLAEMEEIIEYRKIEERCKTGAHRHPANAPWKNARARLLSVWRDRLDGCRADAEVHASILGVRSLLLKQEEEIDSTLKLSELSTQAHKYKFAERVLLDPLAALNANINGAVFGFGVSEALNVRVDFTRFSESPAALGQVIDRILLGDLLTIVPNYSAKHDQWSKTLVAEAGGLERLTIQHRLYFAYVKHLWSTGHEEEAMTRLAYLCDVVDMVSHCEGMLNTQLRVAVWLELGEWKISKATSPSSIIPVPLQADALTAFKRATMLANCGYKAWHTWALLNFRIAQQSKDRDGAGQRLEGSLTPNRLSERALRNHVVAAVKGFANAVSLGTKRETASVQQDLLNLLTCLFRYGSLQDVAPVINECIGVFAIEAWLGVLPQLLARIHIKDPSVRSVLHPLLIRLGEKHPQALMYPLSVLLKSPVFERKHAAEILMSSMRGHSKELVEEALLVSSELIRVAILWLETWHEGLEDASRLYFGEGNVSGMLELLLPLHEKLERGAETSRERDFLKSFGQDLAQAHLHIKDYVRLISEGGTNIPTGPSAQGFEDQGGGRLSRQSDEAETFMNKVRKNGASCLTHF